MQDKDLDELRKVIQNFNNSLKLFLPQLQTEVNNIINEGNRDSNSIENMLDTLLSISKHGLGTEIFIQLLNYYKTIDADGAKFYWDEFDGIDNA